jgi:hypothetical protein
MALYIMIRVLALLIFLCLDSDGNGISQHSTDTGGLIVGYRYHFDRWLVAEADYGYDRNAQQNFTSSGLFNVQANVHQATANLVVTLPVNYRVKPYSLAGTGAIVFNPTNNRGNPCPELCAKPKRRPSTEEVWISPWRDMLVFVPSMGASSTTGLTLNWPH